MPTTVATDQESTTGLLNPVLNSSTSSSKLQASTMVPASALGALLDDVFTGEPAGSNSKFTNTVNRLRAPRGALFRLS